MSLRSALIVATLVAWIPLIAHAEETTVWDFSESRIPGRWDLRDTATATPTPEGLHIVMQLPGFLWRSTDLPHPIDVVTLTITSRKEREAELLWHVKTMEEGVLTKLPFVVPGKATPRTIDIVPGKIKLWEPRTDQLGFAFPPGSDVLIHAVHLRHWNTWEKAVEAAKSFWTFDTFRAYSINFLWGPLLAFNPPARTQLFDHLPPRASSAVYLFHLLLVLAGIGTLAARFLYGSASLQRSTRIAFVLLAVILWLLFDLRMGAEVLSYAYTDLQTHVLPPTVEKTFRTHERFYDIAAQAMPTLTEVPQYGLIVGDQTPWYQNLRYMTYPSLPILPGPEVKSLRLLFVYGRPDIRVKDDVVVNQDGKVVTSGGQLLHDFGSGTFLYGPP